MSIGRVLKHPREVAAWSRRLRRDGQRIALVPTMGALHEGHLSLMREGLSRADVVAVSIFVNPAQFGPQEDLSRYPRDLEGDVARCASVGVSMIYAPEPATVYPPGYRTWVSVEGLGDGLCGASRPGHFRGVSTIITKLFSLFRPHVALFGEKDYQQLQIIKAVNADLELGVDVVGVPTVREADGLALSSRNAYLSATDRERALSISRGLRAAQAHASAAAHAGARITAAMIEAQVHAQLQAAKVEAEYVQLVDAQTLQPLDGLNPGERGRLMVAARLGTTRLIDNVAIPAPVG
jgi:pantoate--beta-alanine ligase